MLVFQCELPFTAAFLRGVAGQVHLLTFSVPTATGWDEGICPKGRTGAVCPGLGKMLSSSPGIGINLSTVSIYLFILFYPNTCAKIN